MSRIATFIAATTFALHAQSALARSPSESVPGGATASEQFGLTRAEYLALTVDRWLLPTLLGGPLHDVESGCPVPTERKSCTGASGIHYEGTLTPRQGEGAKSDVFELHFDAFELTYLGLSLRLDGTVTLSAAAAVRGLTQLKDFAITVHGHTASTSLRFDQSSRSGILTARGRTLPVVQKGSVVVLGDRLATIDVGGDCHEVVTPARAHTVCPRDLYVLLPFPDARASEGSEPAQNRSERSKWENRQTVDEMDGEQRTVALLHADRDILGTLDKPATPALVFRCKGGKTEAYFATDVMLDTDYRGDREATRVRYRLDDGKPVTLWLTRSTDYEGAFLNRPAQFGKKLMAHKKLLVELSTSGGKRQNTEFDLSGAAAGLAGVAKACKW